MVELADAERGTVVVGTHLAGSNVLLLTLPARTPSPAAATLIECLTAVAAQMTGH